MLSLVMPMAWGQDNKTAQQEKPDANKTAVQAEVQKLKKERDELGLKLQKEFQAAKEKDEKEKIRDRFMKALDDFVARGFALAEKDVKDPGAVDAIFFAMESDPAGKAVDKGIEQLRTLMDKSPERTVQGLACLNLARQLDSKAEEAQPKDAEKLASEVKALLMKAVEKYGDVKTPDGTVGGEAKNLLGLTVGNAAPDIQGTDIDGKPFKLSDYKGKVVLIDFWASWCGPCMALVPHNIELMKKMDGKPFALVGVNLDQDKDDAKKAVDSAKITWRSFHDGESKIGSAWRVRGIPALFVVDAQGVMRHKFVGSNHAKEVDTAIEALVKEAESGGAKNEKK